MRRFSLVSAALILAGLATVGQSQIAATQPAHPSGKATVLWISVDGFRHDYADRDHPPFISRLMREGAYSKRMETIFPSLTFPSHVAEETGVTVTHSGIPANDFYDRVAKRNWVFPPDGSLLTAEPIWETATRQGVRSEVYDWPLSQMQKGPEAAAYFNPGKFDGTRTGDQRMDRVIDAYEADKNPQPVRLLMGYFEGTDKPGHKYGPESKQVDAMVGEVDGILQRTFDRAYRDFEAKRTSPDDMFYFLMTTDHGMATVKTLVRLDFILGLPPEITAPHEAPAAGTQPGWVGGGVAGGKRSDAIVVTSGPIANIYLPETLSPEAREERIAGYLKKLRAKPYIRAYRQSELPPEWDYRSATRIGDIVVVLEEPYTFSNRIPEQEYPVDKGGGPLGMHGYTVADNPNMAGFTVMWRSRDNWGGKDLGVVHSTQFHATVARWLGIQPAAGAGPAIQGAE